MKNFSNEMIVKNLLAYAFFFRICFRPIQRNPPFLRLPDARIRSRAIIPASITFNRTPFSINMITTLVRTHRCNDTLTYEITFSSPIRRLHQIPLLIPASVASSIQSVSCTISCHCSAATPDYITTPCIARRISCITLLSSPSTRSSIPHISSTSQQNMSLPYHPYRPA